MSSHGNSSPNIKEAAVISLDRKKIKYMRSVLNLNERVTCLLSLVRFHFVVKLRTSWQEVR
jgi:hypothetical protein